jgi:broad specificity phosphatase PhoE
VEDSNTPSQFEQIEYTPLIREASFGLCEGKHKDLRGFEDKFIEAYSLEQGVSMDQVPRSETHEQVYKRCDAFMEFIYQSLLDEEQGGRAFVENDAAADGSSPSFSATSNVRNVLVISHGGYIKRLLTSLLGHSNIDTVNNCSITTLVGSFSRAEDGAVHWSSSGDVTINGTTHLANSDSGVSIMSKSTE